MRLGTKNAPIRHLSSQETRIHRAVLIGKMPQLPMRISLLRSLAQPTIISGLSPTFPSISVRPQRIPSSRSPMTSSASALQLTAWDSASWSRAMPLKGTTRATWTTAVTSTLAPVARLTSALSSPARRTSTRSTAFTSIQPRPTRKQTPSALFPSPVAADGTGSTSPTTSISVMI